MDRARAFEQAVELAGELPTIPVDKLIRLTEAGRFGFPGGEEFGIENEED